MAGGIARPSEARSPEPAGSVAGSESSRVIRAGRWRIRVTVRAGVPRVESLAGLARVMERALAAAGAPAPATIGLILSADAELARLNEEHLGGSGPTDVLSFPLLPPAAFPAYDDARSGPSPRPGTDHGAVRFVLPPGRQPDLGEIVVSVERAVAQAQAGLGGQTGDVCWSPRDELRLLVTHGTLHVCGWDHAEPIEEAAMRRLEAQLLAAADEVRAGRAGGESYEAADRLVVPGPWSAGSTARSS